MKKTSLNIALVIAICIGEHPPQTISKAAKESAKILEGMLNGSTLILCCQNRQISYQAELIASEIGTAEIRPDKIYNSNHKFEAKTICQEISKAIDSATDMGFSNIVFVVDEHNKNNFSDIISKVIGCNNVWHVKAGQIMLFETDVEQISVICDNQVKSESFHRK